MSPLTIVLIIIIILVGIVLYMHGKNLYTDYPEDKRIQKLREAELEELFEPVIKLFEEYKPTEVQYTKFHELRFFLKSGPTYATLQKLEEIKDKWTINDSVHSVRVYNSFTSHYYYKKRGSYYTISPAYWYLKDWLDKKEFKKN